MNRILLAAAVALAAAVPAFAGPDATMTCGDYMKQDEATRMETAQSLGGGDGMMAGGNMAAGNMAGGKMAGSTSAADLEAACGEHPDMTLHDAIGAMGNM